MKQNKDIEQILLDNSTFEQTVKTKFEQDFNKELEIAKTSKKKSYINDIKEAPKEKLFTKYSTFEVINKSSKTKSYINGLQAEGYLGTNTTDRTKLLVGETKSFVAGNLYIKFVKVRI